MVAYSAFLKTGLKNDCKCNRAHQRRQTDSAALLAATSICITLVAVCPRRSVVSNSAGVYVVVSANQSKDAEVRLGSWLGLG